MLQWKKVTTKQTPAEFYVEARDEAIALCNNGWMAPKECRDILRALYRQRYLMSYIIYPRQEPKKKKGFYSFGGV